MQSTWNIDQYVKHLEDNEIENFLNVVGAQGVTWADKDFDNYSYSPLTKEKTGALRNCLCYATSTKAATPKAGNPIEQPTKGRVWIGGLLAYLPRYEFGFSGKDSLGRTYNQKARPILRNIIEKHKDDIIKLVGMIKGK
jgi:hypothetical protein